MAALAYWVDTLNPFLIRFHGNLGIHWYGVTYVVGFAAGAWLLYRYARAGKSLVGPERIPDLMTWSIVGVFVGGRLGHYFLYDQWRSFPSDPLRVFRVWDGGMASHGGMIGVALALAWFARTQKVPFLHLGDIITTAATPGLFFVRIGNFINGELWGHVSYVRWAVIFPDSAPPGTPIPLIPPRHPSQLYEAGLEGLLLGAYLQLRMWKSDAVRKQPGRLSGEFLIGYALMRIAGEQFREPDASLILGMSRGIFYSIFLVGGGLWLCLRPKRPLA
ncbi:MAG TPA: prolipoprotein diacylglyceryl transferase [Opitutaceae bacterium]|nr:prolipoprotein diacylglyceryl transferase [Opitutaceae bacterium]